MRVRQQELTEEYPVRISLINVHTDHLKSKVAKVMKSTPLFPLHSRARGTESGLTVTFMICRTDEATTVNPLWAIYQHAADQLLPQRYEDVLDLKKIR